MHLTRKSHNDLIDGDQVIAEYDNAGTLLRKFIYGTGIDEPILLDDGANQYYYHFDGLGSVTALTDSAGTAVETYTYDVYGQPSTTSLIGNPYYFTGRRLDVETGLYHYRARAYSPQLGRFLQGDPLGIDDENAYSYCYNDPVNWIDPWGLDVIGLPKGVTPPGAGLERLGDKFKDDLKDQLDDELKEKLKDLTDPPKPGENSNPPTGTKEEIKVKQKEKEEEKLSPAKKAQEKHKKKKKKKGKPRDPGKEERLRQKQQKKWGPKKDYRGKQKWRDLESERMKKRKKLLDDIGNLLGGGLGY